MSTKGGRVVILIAAAVLIYLFLTTAALDSMRFDYIVENVFFVSAIAILVAVCAWLLIRANLERDRRSRFRQRLRAVAVVALLAALMGVAWGAQAVVFPAILLTITLVLTTSVSQAGRILAILPLLLFMIAARELFYFGAILMLIGLLMMSGRLEGELRELFPRRVGGA